MLNGTDPPPGMDACDIFYPATIQQAQLPSG